MGFQDPCHGFQYHPVRGISKSVSRSNASYMGTILIFPMCLDKNKGRTPETDISYIEIIYAYTNIFVAVAIDQNLTYLMTKMFE